MNVLNDVRLGRASAQHLERLVESRTLTEAEAKRLIGRINTAFDRVLGVADKPGRPDLVVIDGGRS